MRPADQIIRVIKECKDNTTVEITCPVDYVASSIPDSFFSAIENELTVNNKNISLVVLSAWPANSSEKIIKAIVNAQV